MFNKMKIINQISIILVLILSVSCKNSSLNPNDNQGGRPKYGGRPTNIEDTTSIPDPDESGPEYGDKAIEWADGNTYSYDFTEQVNLTDSTGTRTITIYRRNKPTDVDCDVEKCRWCGKEMIAEDYSIVEFPDCDVLRGRTTVGSILSFYVSMLDSRPYFDLDNNKIRTEWKVNCHYGVSGGFCSLKCKSEYNR